MHYVGNPSLKGICPAGGHHEQHGSWEYVSVYGVPAGPFIQKDWRACRRCQGMFYGPQRGVCPGGGPHDATSSWDYLQRYVPQ
jgi:hypothetical protein